MLLPSRLGVDRQEQVPDLALLHPDFTVAVREAREPVRLAQLGNVAGREDDAPHVLRRGQPDFL